MDMSNITVVEGGELSSRSLTDEARSTLQRINRGSSFVSRFSKEHKIIREHEMRVAHEHFTTLEEALRIASTTRLALFREQANNKLTEVQTKLNSAQNMTMRAFMLDQLKHIETTWNDYAKSFRRSIREAWEAREQSKDIPMLYEMETNRLNRHIADFAKFENKMRDNFEAQVDRILQRLI